MVKPLLQLYEYQQNGIDEIIEKFNYNDLIMYQLSTGGGKTFIFSFLTKWWVQNKNQKVLINCHREELIHQTVTSLATIGVSCQAILSTTKRVDHNCMVYVGMIQTSYNRLVKNDRFFGDIGLMINDEAHILIFDKIFPFFPNTKILGCSATPVILKRQTFFRCKYCKNDYNTEVLCCEDLTEEWSKPFRMADIYNDIVVGPKIDKLIEFGSLVKEISFVKQYVDSDKLKTDKTGEFTTKSIDSTYNDDSSVFNVLLNYEEYCQGKKTIIFNSSSKNNLLVYNRFKEAGHNIRMFDSVNVEESGNRKELIKWFNETEDAILSNVDVFTTGFDSKEVQAIILNRPTQSLAQFLQMVGRGGRSSSKIYKDNFIVIDGGGNIDRFGEWSDPTRDWEKIFFEGLGKEKPKRENEIDINECPECGMLYPKTDKECPECGYEIPSSPKKIKSESDDVLLPIRNIPPPNAEKIYRYTVSRNEDINFAFKIMIGQIVDMFRFYRVSKELYLSTSKNGKLEKRIKEMIHKVYFVLIGKQDIKASNNRTIQYLINKVIDNLNKYYGC